MTLTSTTSAVAATADYLSRCDEHLGDLPPAIQAQLRQDIAEIVDEVCGELGGAPTELVGPPERFVAELRAAAGWPLPAPAVSPGGTEPDSHSLRHLLRAVREHRSLLWTRALLPELRPAWWVLRGYLIAVAIGRVTGAPRRPEWLLELLPYWPVIGSRLLGLAVIASAIYVSVEAGRRPLSRSRRLGRALASIVAISTAMALAADLKSHATVGPYLSAPTFVDHNQGPPPDVGAPFEVVHIGSDLTGDRIEVLDLPSAETTLDRLLEEAPPAAVFIDRGGERVRPGNRDNWQAALQALVEEGALNAEAPASS